eukprot:s4058_g7.t1
MRFVRLPLLKTFSGILRERRAAFCLLQIMSIRSDSTISLTYVDFTLTPKWKAVPTSSSKNSLDAVYTSCTLVLMYVCVMTTMSAIWQLHVSQAHAFHCASACAIPKVDVKLETGWSAGSADHCVASTLT